MASLLDITQLIYLPSLRAVAVKSLFGLQRKKGQLLWEGGLEGSGRNLDF